MDDAVQPEAGGGALLAGDVGGATPVVVGEDDVEPGGAPAGRRGDELGDLRLDLVGDGPALDDLGGHASSSSAVGVSSRARTAAVISATARCSGMPRSRATRAQSSASGWASTTCPASSLR